jgi:hypothetical protein
MKEELRQAAKWTRPVLLKVGTIRDVAGPAGTGTQAGTKS